VLLTSAVDMLNKSKPAAVHFGGHSVDVQLKPGTPGNVAIAVVRTPGWQCSVDGAKADKPKSLSGMMTVAVDADAKEVSCFYRPVGGKMGLALGIVAVLGLALVIGVLEFLRRRRHRGMIVLVGTTLGGARATPRARGPGQYPGAIRLGPPTPLRFLAAGATGTSRLISSRRGLASPCSAMSG
jgi:hypothetical protein